MIADSVMYFVFIFAWIGTLFGAAVDEATRTPGRRSKDETAKHAIGGVAISIVWPIILPFTMGFYIWFMVVVGCYGTYGKTNGFGDVNATAFSPNENGNMAVGGPYNNAPHSVVQPAYSYQGPPPPYVPNDPNYQTQS